MNLHIEDNLNKHWFKSFNSRYILLIWYNVNFTNDQKLIKLIDFFDKLLVATSFTKFINSNQSMPSISPYRMIIERGQGKYLQ